MVSVNDVYQTVLALANKEQRGYITPQEFNLFANQAQNEIFDQYFYDLNHFRRIPGNNTIVADSRDIIEEKINYHRFISEPSAPTIDGSIGIQVNGGVSRLESVSISWEEPHGNGLGDIDGTLGYVNAEEVLNIAEFELYERSPLTRSTRRRPRYLKYVEGPTTWVRVWPTPGPATLIRYTSIQKPTAPNWTYVIVNNKALFNSSANDLRDFDLHFSEEKNLVNKILQLAGVAIKNPDLVQMTGQKEALNIQQTKI